MHHLQLQDAKVTLELAMAALKRWPKVGNLEKSLVLVRALDKREGMEVQRATFLCLDPAENTISPADNTSLRLRAAPEDVLARAASLVAMRAIRAHADTEELRKHDSYHDGERLHGAEWITRMNESANIVLWQLNRLLALRRLQARLVLANPSGELAHYIG